jgi:hypothetical protein
MNRYCPVFLIEVCAAIAAEKFIMSATLPLDVFTKKLSEHLNKYYLVVTADMLSDIAEGYLRVLSESNIDEADELLKSYVYNRVNFRRTGKKRAWGSAISNPSKGLKNLQFDFGLARRNFRAFVFSYKNHATNSRANGWTLESFEHVEFIKEISTFEYSGFDFLS